MRLTSALLLLVLAPVSLVASPLPNPDPNSKLQGIVADSSGAALAGAEVDLVEADGKIDARSTADSEGNFQLIAPHEGDFLLVVSEPGFETVKTPVKVLGSSATTVKPAINLARLRIVLPIAATSTSVEVSAGSSEDLTAPEANHDSSVMSSQDLKALPIFDNDFASAMSAFLDDSATATGGSGLLVDGVEANRSTVSASAVQEVRINQDPYSAQYYWPGRGQMEIITKAAADRYHGQFNFTFRDSAMNAQNALAPSKPYEQRRLYEGHVMGPIVFAQRSSFLVSFNRAEEDKNSVVSAVIPSSSAVDGENYSANVAAPTRDTEFSLRGAHKFSDRHSAYAQYSYQDWTGRNLSVGGQTMQPAGYNDEYREDDYILHADSTLSNELISSASLVAERDRTDYNNTTNAPKIVVSGDFTSGSAQTTSVSSEYNMRLSDNFTWSHGKQMLKFGFGIPHLDRRAFDDHTNELGTYTFGPTYASDGTTVLASALANYTAARPSGYSLNQGAAHYIYHQQEMGAYIQDQIKLGKRLSITPGLRYDWQNFLATKRLAFSPRMSFAWMLDEASETVLRGGGGIYYDRFGSSPITDLARYELPRRYSISLSLDPTNAAESCYPITDCQTITSQPPNRVELASNVKVPYQIQFGLSIERKLGEKATAIASAYTARGVNEFRSVDINAPTASSDYATRPDGSYGRIRQMQSAGFWEGSGLDLSYRGRFNKYFTGFGRYTWSHYGANTGGLSWYPQNQAKPNDEWSNAGWDRRHRVGMYAIFNPESIANLSLGIFANSGTPWTITTGSDPYGDGLFNARPTGVARNTMNYPNYVDVDLRWGHDFALTADKGDEAPKLGFSASAFNLMNHVNASSIDTVESSSTFKQMTAANSPRRVQLGMRVQF